MNDICISNTNDKNTKIKTKEKLMLNYLETKNNINIIENSITNDIHKKNLNT